MKLILPDEFDIKIIPKKNGNFILEYQEFFGDNIKPKVNKKKLPEILDSTITILSIHLFSQFGRNNVVVKRTSEKLGAYIKINNITRNQISDFMVGEFMPSSSFGEIKIGKLIEMAVSSFIFTPATQRKK